MNNSTASNSVGKRIIVFKNGTNTDGKVISLKEESWEHLITAATETCGISVKKIFTARGKEIHDIKSIRNNQLLFVSPEEPFALKRWKTREIVSNDVRDLMIMYKRLMNLEKKFYALLGDKFKECSMMMKAKKKAPEGEDSYLKRRVKIHLLLIYRPLDRKAEFSKAFNASNHKEVVVKMKKMASELEKNVNSLRGLYQEFLKYSHSTDDYVSNLLTHAKVEKNVMTGRHFDF